MEINHKITFDIIIIGGGAAGFFSASNIALSRPDLSILILEQSKEVLNKVRISGGGRCNVTHACYDAKTLSTYYPRGHRELIGPFTKFGCQDTVDWFEGQGVAIETLEDGCMFPVSNTSQTIIDCFVKCTHLPTITIKTQSKVNDIVFKKDGLSQYTIKTDSHEYSCPTLIITAGSSPNIWRILEREGYEISSAVPSLFTFNLPNHPISAMMGLTVPNAIVKIKNTKIATSGPLLITHWGLSGPAILKASAWGARELANMKYDFEATVDWLPQVSHDDISSLRTSDAKRKIRTHCPLALPNRLWHYMIDTIGIHPDKVWADITKVEMNALKSAVKEMTFNVLGKTTFKEEFVTAGGVALSQVNFKTFESKRHTDLYFAGEILDIDGVTGGFNFQAAWTGGFLVAQGISEGWNV